jgi:hypothetical protein
MRALLIAILVLIVGGAIAVGAYDAGIAQGAAQLVAPAANGAPPAVAYYGRPFGFLFPILGLFLFFALMRALIWSGRGYGHHGWYGDSQPGVPGRFEEWHKRAHGDTSTGTDRSTPPRQ